MFALQQGLAALFIAPLAIALTACSPSKAEDPRLQPPVVRTAVASAGGQPERAFTGIVVARVQSDLGFRVPGKVVERLVDTGQSVKRGQALMRIDPTDLTLATQAQSETVLAAKARALQTAADEKRYANLVAAGAVSASAYDQVKAAAESARALLSAAEAQANVVKNSAGYSVLVADVDGVVVDTLSEPGQVVAAGQTVVRLAKSGPREALINLPESVRPALGSTGSALVFGSTGTEAVAKLRQLASTANPQTRTFEARYVLDGQAATAPLGSTVTVRIPTGARTGAIAVPLSALFDPGKGPGVWVIPAAASQVEWRAVELAGLTEESAQLSSGLQSGDRYVTLGAHLLHQGERVRVGEIGGTPK